MEIDKAKKSKVILLVVQLLIKLHQKSNSVQLTQEKKEQNQQKLI